MTRTGTGPESWRRPFERDLRERAFAPSPADSPSRTGLEVEVFLRGPEGEPLPIRRPSGEGPCGLGLLRATAERTGWVDGPTHAGVPTFRTRAGSLVSFEPGGQVEVSTQPFGSLKAVAREAEAAIRALQGVGKELGIELRFVGHDAQTKLESTGRFLEAERYRRMELHYDRRGEAGRTMMRLTAGIHLNVDLGSDPLQRWHLSRALIPVLIAAFANSPGSGGRNRRAEFWRRLDPSRTGVPGGGADAVADYTAFAMGADAFLLGDPAEPARPFAEWVARGAVEVHDPEWLLHLSTLFPEVRPRGYLEVRSVDALAPDWYVVAPALLAGILEAPGISETLLDELPSPDAGLLERAGRAGLGDPGLAAAARLAFDAAEEGLARLAPGRATPWVLERFRAYRDRYLDRGRDPGSDRAPDPPSRIEGEEDRSVRAG